mgnify:CR=1 FL=1
MFFIYGRSSKPVHVASEAEHLFLKLNCHFQHIPRAHYILFQNSLLLSTSAKDQPATCLSGKSQAQQINDFHRSDTNSHTIRSTLPPIVSACIFCSICAPPALLRVPTQVQLPSLTVLRKANLFDTTGMTLCTCRPTASRNLRELSTPKICARGSFLGDGCGAAPYCPNDKFPTINPLPH